MDVLHHNYYNKLHNYFFAFQILETCDSFHSSPYSCQLYLKHFFDIPLYSKYLNGFEINLSLSLFFSRIFGLEVLYISQHLSITPI